ncbi:hypothetical protein BGZ99_002375 [Dissophora globulifera]|uniref:Uncharacterized protein n=1 Tax=Dissophora globulifera TaxID=979702 RepID=A0A9P6RXQ5_9FUNG|nr:hypothetical protein BGZ99_002375 [Dissophora globulifera]
MYEILCLSSPEHFDVKTADHKPLSNVRDATIATNKRAIFGLFLDLESQQSMCLKFSDRILRAPQAREKLLSAAKLMQVSWTWTKVEEATEFLDITEILSDACRKKRQVVFSGTDYGLCTISETVALTLEEIQVHLNRYQVLSGLPSEIEEPDVSYTATLSASMKRDKDSHDSEAKKRRGDAQTSAKGKARKISDETNFAK